MGCKTFLGSLGGGWVGLMSPGCYCLGGCGHGGVFGAGSGFRVGWRAAVRFLFFSGCLVVLAGFSFWVWGWALGWVVQWDFEMFMVFPGFLTS